ncbi:MAG: 2Fe-2S iron-sulfur cluster-binding protein [Candidatus Thermoplasmatota archaeon]|nr:2Fe-2S iron-sulfur cluster-binding protein [Candidatus Thermoplasmatota archaeon]
MAGTMGERHKVHFVREDLTVEIDEEDYILAEGERAGLDLPYSCRMGTCSVCIAKVEGEVDQSEGVVLTDGEKEDGYCLICIAKPKGELKIWTDDVP